jgi:hypothetical protein
MKDLLGTSIEKESMLKGCTEVFLHPHIPIDAPTSSPSNDLPSQRVAPTPLRSVISDRRKSCIDLEPSLVLVDCKCPPTRETDIGQIWKLLLRVLPATVPPFH